MPADTPLRGPRAHERPELTPDWVRLAGGVPLYHAFLADKPYIAKEEAQEAQDKTRYYITNHPNAVMQCEGKTPDEARKILESIEPSAQIAA